MLKGDRIGDVYQPRATAHQVGISDLVAVARFARALPDRVILVGLQPADTSTRVGLSPNVEAALPCALAEVRRQCKRAHRVTRAGGEIAAGGTGARSSAYG